MEDPAKSRVIKRENAISYFNAICNKDRWLQMPSKKRNAIFQNFNKFENFCYLEDFVTLFKSSNCTF